MPFTAYDVLYQASITLNDAQSVRWPLPELLSWLNAGVREIVVAKPDANSKTVELAMATGTVQTLAEDHYALVRVIRNLTNVANATPRVGGASITPTKRHVLDASYPGWQNPTVLPYTKEVSHVIQDDAEARTFYVVPGNNGTGLIEAVVSVMPNNIATPANPLALASYSAASRALSKAAATPCPATSSANSPTRRALMGKNPTRSPPI